MDGLRSWSTFEQQPRDNPSDADDVTSSSEEPGMDALYVSSSSLNIAPASATLLRHSGLTVPNNNNNSHSKDSGDTTTGGGEDEEFRLRFHWMRPHPSLAFALEEEILEGDHTHTDDNINNGTKSEKKESKQTNNNSIQSNPAVEASKLMEAYRASQIKKQLGTAENTEGSASQDDDNTKTNYNATNLPLELPKLRINLASLVEPPLMSSWLPGEDVDISYDDDDNEDDDREEEGR